MGYGCLVLWEKLSTINSGKREQYLVPFVKSNNLVELTEHFNT